MKKSVMIALSLVCVLSCIFALAACNDDPATNNNDPVAVTSITLNKSELTLEVGGEYTLTATVAPDDATDKSITWASSDTAVATVANGKVTAVAAGSATITAKAGEKSAACSVTVSAPAVTDGLAGKTFVFADVISDGMDADTKAEYIRMNKGIVFAFGTDGTVNETVASQAEGMPNMEMSGTYVIDGQNVTLTPISVTMDGVPGDPSSMSNTLGKITFDGTNLIVLADNGQGAIIKFIFKEKKN